MGSLVARWSLRALVAALLFAVAAYVLDWSVWRIREGRGTGFGSMTVSRFVVAPLKGNKVEYYPDGTGEERCSRSLFGQGGDDACWWMARHRVVLE